MLVILAGLSLPPMAVSELLARILRVEVVTRRFPIVGKCLLEEAQPSPTKLTSVVEVPGASLTVRKLSSALFPPVLTTPLDGLTSNWSRMTLVSLPFDHIEAYCHRGHREM